MSNRYKGGIISATPPTTSGPYADGAASGAWTLEQQMQVTAAGTWPTAGNINPSAFIENLFSTYLYTGNGSTQTITNGIDLAGKGGLVWTKPRTTTTFNDHILVDSARGDFQIQSNTTAANNAIASFNFASTGYTAPNNTRVNASSVTYVSWTFRKQPKFFDVVTYTGTGSARTVAHNLGSAPGCIIVKRTDTTGSWAVYHQARGQNFYTFLNTTAAEAASATYWNNTAPTSTVFTVGTNTNVNASGGTYVAYLFAHDAGGFGLTGTDNVISCGSYTTDASAKATINLGYEPQWVLVKKTSGADNWYLMDTMRGFAYSNTALGLQANTSTAESSMSSGANGIYPLATGFQDNGTFATSSTFIYIAIRRGPMKVPTSGTSVYGAYAKGTGTAVNYLETAFPSDAFWAKNRTSGSYNWFDYDRLRGNTQYLGFNTTAAEVTGTGGYNVNFNTSTTTYPYALQLGETNDYNTNTNGTAAIFYWLRRAPSFFDEVCYTGTGVNGQTYSHNLGVAPELMIFKERAVNDQNWWVYVASLGADNNLLLNSTGAAGTGSNLVNGTNPTASVFTTGPNSYNNQSAQTYVAYLFATCAGVSKVGSYTGTGTTKQVDCGFTGGARFVMIKRTDSTGGWYVWDSARGIVAGNDPYLLLNSTDAEVTNTDYVDTYSAGFEISSTAPAAINASGGTFIFLAIA